MRAIAPADEQQPESYSEHGPLPESTMYARYGSYVTPVSVLLAPSDRDAQFGGDI